MKQHSLAVRLMSVFCIALLGLASCKKVNLATELGGDLIPAVDNITTFDTILSVQAFNYQMPVQLDSSRSAYTDIQFLGAITNDPQFGKSAGTMFLQLKPAVLKNPFAFTDKANIVALDSVVLVLSYRSIYGDSLQPQQAQVFEIDQASNFRADSNYMISSNNFTYTTPLSLPKTFLPTSLNDSLFLFREAAANQLRIRLDDAFGNRLLRYDSSNAYGSDSLFNTMFKGFAVVPGTNGGGNALMGFSLADTNTKLAVYYRYTNAGNTDTAVTYFRFNQSLSASANYIQRDYSGSELAAVTGDAIADPLLYIQNAPGTYARLLIPGLAELNNRIVHRAELIVEQIYDPGNLLFNPPAYLLLDYFDSSSTRYATPKFDFLSSTVTGPFNFATYGSIPFKTTDNNGKSVYRWNFDLSRHVQAIVTKTQKYFPFRLYSPFITRIEYSVGNPTNVSRVFGSINVNSSYGTGRVKVGGGNHPTQPMRVRIVYSKL